VADANGGWREGFWLLDDVLDPSAGGGIVWDDLLPDKVVEKIATCELAVEILDLRVVTANGRVGDGPAVPADPARAVAGQLLTAQANAAAGACASGDVKDVMAWAERLLDRLDFDGTKATAYLETGSGDAKYAARVAAFLEAYNRCDCDFGKLPSMPPVPAF
jgi:hypothetical protein